MRQFLRELKRSMAEDRLQLLTAGFILLMLAVFPLVTGNRGYANITAVKHGFLLVCALGYFILLAVVLLGKIRRREMRFTLSGIWRKLSLTQKLLLLYGLICITSAIFSPYSQLVWSGGGRYEGLATTLVYIGIFMTVSSFGRFKPAHLYALLVPVLVNGVIALIQLAGGNPFWLYPPGYNYYDGNTAYSGEFLGTIGNSGLFSAFFCLAVPAFVVYFIHNNKNKKTYLFVAAALLSVYVMLSSKVAAGLVGLTAGVLVITPVLLRTKKARLIFGAIMLILLIICLLMLLDYNGPEAGLVYESSAILHGEAEDSFGSGRVLIWRETLDLIGERPLLGGGPDTLGRRLDLTFTNGSGGNIRETRVDNAHNDYLNIAANIGVPGLLVYLAALISCAIGWLRRYRDTAVLVCGAAVLCYSIQIVFSFSLCITAPLFWIFWGLLDSALAKKSRMTPGGTPGSKIKNAGNRAGILLRISLYIGISRVRGDDDRCDDIDDDTRKRYGKNG